MADFFEKHRLAIVWSIFTLLVVGIPGFFYSNWEKFGTNKTPFEWINQHGWKFRGVVTVSALWVLSCAILSLVLYWIFGIAAKRQQPQTLQVSANDRHPVLLKAAVDEVRSEWSKLTPNQKQLVKRLLVTDELNWDQIDNAYWLTLPLYSDFSLSDYLLQRSTLLEHEGNGVADLRRYIQHKRDGTTDWFSGVQSVAIRPDLKAALRQIIAAEETV